MEKKEIMEKLAADQNREERKGLTLVYTGNGKGKTTAALGLMFRAWGSDFSVGCIQFIKSTERVKGERIACERLGIPFYTMGKGFVFTPENKSIHSEAAQAALDFAKEKILSGTFDLLVLDEITYPLKFGWLDVDELIAWLKEHKPPSMHLVMTGRDAPEPLVAFADMVTEVREIKHHYATQGIVAQLGIEF